MAELSNIQALKQFFPGITTKELGDLPKEDREELAQLAKAELGA